MSISEHDTALDDDFDIFHAVTMSEETSWKQGYTEGAEEGRVKGFIEGFALGAQRGTDIGKEVGFYAGYSEYLMRLKQTLEPKSRTDGKNLCHRVNERKEDNQRIMKVCETIIKIAKTFDDVEPTAEALTDNLSQIRGKFKQLKDMLNQLAAKTVGIHYQLKESYSVALQYNEINVVNQ